jgi:hypothetical protein
MVLQRLVLCLLCIDCMLFVAVQKLAGDKNELQAMEQASAVEKEEAQKKEGAVPKLEEQRAHGEQEYM